MKTEVSRGIKTTAADPLDRAEAWNRATLGVLESRREIRALEAIKGELIDKGYLDAAERALDERGLLMNFNTHTVEPLPSETNLQGPALKLVSAKPDVVFLSNYIHHDLSGQELAKHGYNGPKLGTLMTTEKAVLAKGGLEGAVSYGYDTAQPFFIERFRARYGRDPDGIGADNAYDIVQLFAATVNASGTDNPPVIRRKLQEVRDFRGASGLFSMDGKGGVVRQPVLFVVRDSRVVRLKD